MPRGQVLIFGAKLKLQWRLRAHVVVSNTRVDFWRLVLAFRLFWVWLLTWWEFIRLVDL